MSYPLFCTSSLQPVSASTFKEVTGPALALPAGGAGNIVVDLGVDWASWGRCAIQSVATSAVIAANNVFYGGGADATVSYIRWSDDGVSPNLKRIVRRSSLGVDGKQGIPAIGAIPITAVSLAGVATAAAAATSLVFSGAFDLVPQARYLLVPVAAVIATGAGNYACTIQLFN